MKRNTVFFNTLRWGLIGLLGMAASAARAQETQAYLERFINTTGSNAEASTVGWSFYGSSNPLGSSTNADGTLTIAATSGTTGGLSGAVGAELSFDDGDFGYVFLYDGNPANILTMANESISRTGQEVTKIEFRIRDRNTDTVTTVVHPAVKVGGTWYVHTQGFSNDMTVESATYGLRTFTWTTEGWKVLNFDSANVATMALAADPAGMLPSGDIENFGMYVPHPGGASAVFDEYAVYVAPAEVVEEPVGAIVYEERFLNTTGANADSSTVDWILYGSNNPGGPLVTDATSGTTGGVSGATGRVISNDDNDLGFIFMYDPNPADLVALADETITRVHQEISEVGFTLRDRTSPVYNVQVVVQIGDVYYVNDEVFSVDGTVGEGVTVLGPRTFHWTTSHWNVLNFDPLDASTVAIGEDVTVLPRGNIQKIGLYADHPGGGAVVIDEFTVRTTARGAEFTATPPAIDGVMDAAWAGSIEMPIVMPVADTASGEITGAADLSGNWSALFDTTNLYILVEVTDDVVMNYGGEWDNNPEWWVDDGIEIYLDPDLSSGSSYDRVNDLQLGIRPLDPANVVFYGANSVNNLEGIQTGATTTEAGYVIEVAIPWSSLGVNVPVLGRIGIEVAINDGDINEGTWPPARLGWVSDANNAAGNPSVFGLLPFSAVPLQVGVGSVPAFDPRLGDVFGAGAGWAFSSLIGWFYHEAVYPWVYQLNSGWFYVYPVPISGVTYLYHFENETWVSVVHAWPGWYYDHDADMWHTF